MARSCNCLVKRAKSNIYFAHSTVYIWLFHRSEFGKLNYDCFKEKRILEILVQYHEMNLLNMYSVFYSKKKKKKETVSFHSSKRDSRILMRKFAEYFINSCEKIENSERFANMSTYTALKRDYFSWNYCFQCSCIQDIRGERFLY